MMRNEGSSPFLRHRFSSDDVLLPGLREAAAALCRAADRETLDEVIELLKRRDPRQTRAASSEFRTVSESAPGTLERRPNTNHRVLRQTDEAELPSVTPSSQRRSLSSSSLAQAVAMGVASLLGELHPTRAPFDEDGGDGAGDGANATTNTTTARLGTSPPLQPVRRRPPPPLEEDAELAAPDAFLEAYTSANLFGGGGAASSAPSASTSSAFGWSSTSDRVSSPGPVEYSTATAASHHSVAFAPVPNAPLAKSKSEGYLAGMLDSLTPSMLLHSVSSEKMLRQLAQAPATVKLGLDLGGTLTKLVIATPLSSEEAEAADDLFQHLRDSGQETNALIRAHDRLTLKVEVDGTRMSMQFVSSSTEYLESMLSFLSDGGDEDDGERVPRHQRDPSSPPASSKKQQASRRIVAAGGGAHKLRASFQSALGIELTPFREMQSIVDGLLLLHELGVEDELYEVGADGTTEVATAWPSPLLPLLLVNVGSGVSCLVVSREGYTRVGGTACGGATFLGLARALTSARTFEEALQLAAHGESKRVDTLVEDIYGSAGCADLGLPPSLTAASFGKLHRENSNIGMNHHHHHHAKNNNNNGAPDRPAPTEADLARGLLEMVAQSCCTLARAHAAQLGCRRRIFFSGGFVDGNPLARATIAKSLESLGGKAHFLRHSDFLGALGAAAHALESTLPTNKVRHVDHIPGSSTTKTPDHSWEPRAATSTTTPPRSPRGTAAAASSSSSSVGGGATTTAHSAPSSPSAHDDDHDDHGARVEPHRSTNRVQLEEQRRMNNASFAEHLNHKRGEPPSLDPGTAPATTKPSGSHPGRPASSSSSSQTDAGD